MEEFSRPYIYGIGIIWGKWLKLEGEKAKEFDRLSMDMIKAAGGTAVPTDITWGSIEEKAGVYNWDYVDHQVEEALKRDLQPFAYVGLTPDWALCDEVKNAEYFQPGIGYRFPPDIKYKQNFKDFVKAVATRYKGKIKYYEFWNESNGCSWVKPDCSNSDSAPGYGYWLERFYKAMKIGDPECVLAVGGLDYHEQVKEGYKYIEELYKYYGTEEGGSGGFAYFDAVAIHPYGESEPLHWKAIEDTRNVMVKYGDSHKKLWLNEYGWKTDDEDKKSKELKIVLDEFAKPKYDYIFQANYLVLTDLPEIDDAHDYGLCDRDISDPNNLRIIPRKSYETFKEVVLGKKN